MTRMQHWLVKILVEATPISGPPWLYTPALVIRLIVDPTTLTSPSSRAPLRSASRIAATVSAVSPDWLMASTRGAGADVGLAVAHFAGDFHLHGEIGEFFENVASVQASVVAGAAGDDHQVLRRFHPLFEHVVQTAEVRHALAFDQAPAGGIGNGFGLLEDLLEHVVRKALQVGGVVLPLDQFGVALHLFPRPRCRW